MSEINSALSAAFTQDKEETPYYAAPQFQITDLHNQVNGGVSWRDPATWVNKLQNAGRFIAVSALSGINSFYNTGAAVGRFFDPGVQERDTATWITSLDTNLADYYKVNQEAADLTGFVLGAIVPGMGGIKIFNAGQVALKTAIAEGTVGGGTARALGLLVPRTDIYMKAAVQEITASTTTLQLLNVNTTRAIASGLWQNVMEAAAFETMVQATMFKSPILQEQDGWDIAKNIGIGGAFAGTVSGIFGAAKLRGALKSAITGEEVLRRPFQELPSFSTATPSSNRIVQLSYDLDMAAVPVAIRNAEGTQIVNNFATTDTLYWQKVTKGLNDIRTEMNTLARKDNELGNIFANLSTPVQKEGRLVSGFSQQTYESFSGARALLRAGEVHPLETAMSKALIKGEAPQVPVSARYVKLFGEDAGAVSTEAPTLLSFGDRMAGVDAIKRAIRQDYGWKQALDPVTSWNATALKGVYAHREAEARYIWASKASGMLKEVPEQAVIHAYDIPVLSRAYDDGVWNIKVMSGEGPSLQVRQVSSLQDLYQQIKQSKEEVADHFNRSFLTPKGKPKKGDGQIPRQDAIQAISKITDVRVNYLEGNPSGVEINDLFATASAQRKYLSQLQERKLSLGTPEAETHVMFLPKYGKVVYELAEDISAINEHVLDGIAHYKVQEKMFRDDAARAVSKVLGRWAEQLPAIPKDKLVTATRNETSAGLFSSDSSAYGTVGSAMSFVGGITRAIKQEFRKNASDALESSLLRTAQKPEAAFEFESLNQKITRTGKQFYLREADDGTMVLVDRTLVKRTADGAEEINWELAEDGVNAFNIEHQETVSLIRDHISTTGRRTQNFRDLHAAQGKVDNKDAEIFRPIRPDLKQYPHFAFVTDPRVTGQGHMTMIHAASEKELAALVNRVPPEYRVIYKKDSEEYFKARGEYDYTRTLNENYINSDLASRGVFSNFFPKSDPQKIVDDVLQQHFREQETLVYESVRLRYEPEFALLEDLGSQYSRVETSRFASRADMIEQTSKNPYFNLIKTALDISKINEHPIVYSANRLLDGAFSRATAAIRDTWAQTNSVKDLDKINTLLDQWGMKPAYYDAALQALANHTAPRGDLTRFVRGANSILSRFTLGLDPLNALNNAIGSNILRGTELGLITRAIREGNSAVAGELSALAKIKLPGAEAEMLAPQKLIARAIKNFWEDKGVLMGKYREMQLIKDRAEQLKLLVEDFTLKGTETVSELEKKLGKGFARAKEMTSGALDKAEKATGNTLAEEFNRFISANVMDQITQIGIKHGLMDEGVARTYINTFVNRVEGNIVASQRPLVFQGPIGQAISLFQSYQFNLIQQLLRYSAEGKAKDLAMLAGLQSTLYGAQSLPGFQAVNTHLIGQMSGNKEHRDMYDAVYGIAGRTAGDFLLYGLPSRMILGWGEGNGVNLYSRGDINPRHLTILPTSLQETPIVAGWGKFFASIYDTTKKIAGGGPVWETFLQGVEHNGVSRPLAGMAQTLQAFGPSGQAYSTSSKGTILYQNDLMSLATLTRLAGGRPLDEAIVNDAMFRVKTYEAARRDRMSQLSETVKASLIQGNDPTPEQINAFAARYAELGGKQKQFNKYMMEMYKSANTSQAEKLSSSLTNPFSYKVQLLMGGEEQ